MEENQWLCLRHLLDMEPPCLHMRLRCKARSCKAWQDQWWRSWQLSHTSNGRDLPKGNIALEAVSSPNSRLSWLLCFQMCMYAPPHWCRAADMPRDQEDDSWGKKKLLIEREISYLDIWSPFYHKRGRASCVWQVLVMLCNSVLGSTQVLRWEGTCVRTDVKLTINTKTTLALLWVLHLESTPYKYFQR